MGKASVRPDVEMIPVVQTPFDWLALPVGVAVFLAAALYQWWRWQENKQLIAQRPKPPQLLPLGSWPRLPLVSVLVAAWNESAHIDQHIQSFQSLHYPNKELVLCAGGDDDTFDRAQRYAGPGITVLLQEASQGKHDALMEALGAAGGEIIFLTDADSYLDDEPFERTLWPVVAEGEIASTGSMRPLMYQENDPFIRLQWAENYYVSRYVMQTHSTGILGANAAVKREMLSAAWKRNERVASGTDYYLALQIRTLGKSIRFVADSFIATHYYDSIEKYARQKSRWVNNLLYWGVKYKDWPRVRSALASMLLGWNMIVILPLLIPIFGVWAVAALLVLWSQAFINRLRYWWFLQIETGKSQITIPLTVIAKLTFIQQLTTVQASFDVLFGKYGKQW